MRRGFLIPALLLLASCEVHQEPQREPIEQAISDCDLPRLRQLLPQRDRVFRFGMQPIRDERESRRRYAETEQLLLASAH